MNNKKIKKAEDRVKVAQEALAKAQEETRILELDAVCRKAEKQLRDVDLAVWEVCNLSEWDPEFKAVYRTLQAARDEFCAVAFGARRRLELLHKLDPQRWRLEGEYIHSLSGLTEDRDMAYDIATSIFDQGFGRGSETAYDELDPVEKNRFTEYREKVVATCGEAGALGFELWAQGRHDT